MMAERKSSLVKQYSNRPSNTLSYFESDDIYLKTVTEKERKTEKSVRFADEESVSDDQSVGDSLQTSKDVITWLPSEHLYSEDTFITESPTGAAEQTSGDTETGPTVQTDPSYGTNTFIDPESEDETRTASDYSYTDSFASSAVFSSLTQSDLSPRMRREWRDITEIVKDIEDLEESEFVTRADPHALDDEGELTDITESEDEEMAEMARQNFLLNSIRKLKLRELQSPRSLAMESQSHTLSDDASHVPALGDKNKAAFCRRMIENCKRRGKSRLAAPASNELHLRAQKPQPQVLEHYGLNSAIVDKLKLENLQQRLKKKSVDLDKEKEKSLAFVRDHQDAEAEYQKQQFISKMMASVQIEKMEELIQDHLIKMHPVKWFADFVNELPSFEDDSWEILYKYKRQIENRNQGENG